MQWVNHFVPLTGEQKHYAVGSLWRHRGVPDVDLSLKLRLRVRHLFLHCAGGGPGEIRWFVATNQRVMNVNS